MGGIVVVLLLAVALWIPTVTHRSAASGCYTEFGALHGGGLATCSHTEADVPTYPNGQRDALFAAVAAGLVTIGLLAARRVVRAQ